ncbi:heme NO-binding domain-containing protein [Chitinivorax sp. PXF-14]|uniref:heme NO-binding domain-containing protein n=1 Tax=Chitinivorax sp. PXF-14 TaxID=3230488 RepID=UPI003466FC95
MLGMVFTEFIEMVEDRFSPEVADAILSAAELPHGGAYTAVGYYPHEEIVRLVGLLSAQTQMPAVDLVRAFGEHLLGRFTVLYPQMFSRHTNLLDFLASIDGEIHVEVRKLYPDAQLPRFSILSRSPDHIALFYQSPREMDALAEGLMLGAIRHFGVPHRLTRRAGMHEGQPGIVFDVHRE